MNFDNEYYIQSLKNIRLEDFQFRVPTIGIVCPHVARKSRPNKASELLWFLLQLNFRKQLETTGSSGNQRESAGVSGNKLESAEISGNQWNSA
jgi:hypothetical protein